MAQSVLVIGAKGRFGRAVSEAFVRAGWNVTTATRDGALGFDLCGADVLACDCLDQNALVDAAQGKQLIVNGVNVAYAKWAETVPRLTEAVIHAARASGATVMIPGNVYVYGPEMPPILTASSAHLAKDRKGQIRREMEAAYESAEGVRTILLRAGDFIDTRASGNWFDMVIVKNLAKRRLTYPGDTRVPHAWAYLPDLAIAAVALAEARERLPQYLDVPFEGQTLTGEELRAGIEAVTGRSIRMVRFPWWALRLLGPLKRDWAELVEMRYLWDTPHQLEDGVSKFIGQLEQTPLAQVLQNALPEPFQVSGSSTSTQTRRWSDASSKA